MVVLTIIASIALTAAGHLTYRGRADALATPETAMCGMARVHAEIPGNVVSLLTIPALAILGLILAVSRRNRSLSVIPVLGFLPSYMLWDRAVREIENVPAFHESFYASFDALNGLVAQISAGSGPSVPCQAGRFTIVRYEKLEGGAIALYTGESSWGSAKWGFVFSENLRVRQGGASVVGLRGEAGDNNDIEALGNGWFVLYDVYTFIKRGWS